MTPVTRQWSLVACVAMLAATLNGCGYAGEDEIQAETAAILERVPPGTPLRGMESHLSCMREQSQWLVCTRRTRAVFTHLNGNVGHVLVNVGNFCT
jgi:hypothetical protein